MFTKMTYISLLSFAYFFLFNINECTVVEESATGAIISFPEISDGNLSDATWEVEPAAFGYADYGGTLEAYLVLPYNLSYHTECTMETPSLNDYIHWITDSEGSDALWILVIDRGDCYFATKVYNAEQLGAAGVIMLDNTEEGFFPMWEPDNYEYDITIPSVEMKRGNGATLMKHLGVTNWNPIDTSNTTYPIAGEAVGTSNNSFIVTKALIEWGLPHEDDRVEWELWTSANDDRTIEFKKNFKSTSLALDFANDTVFTPHYYVLNGSHWGCDSKSLRCGNQCSNSGRYCAVDPEYDVSNGISGMDVVQEDLRQLCIWNFTTKGELNDPIYNKSIWWDYSNLWNDNCFNDTTNENTFRTECSFSQMDTLDSDGTLGLAAYVNNCVNATGGYGYEDGLNTLLEYEVTFREDLNVNVLPAFRVNEFMIYGEVDCEFVTEDGCSVLDSICSGFVDGTQPDICYATPSPTVATPAPSVSNCSRHERDCADECFGTMQTDRCGNCLTLDANQWDNCVGCDNVTNSGFSTNDCGYCINSSRSDYDTYGQGCDNICDSNYYTDDCDICRWFGSSQWNGCYGCDNIAYSQKEYNPCGYCIVNTTTNFDTYGQDCSGTCDGDKEYDQCDNCLDTSDSDWDACINSTTGAPSDPEPGTVDTSSTKSLSSAVIAIGVIAFIVIVIAGLVIYKMYKKQQQQSRQFESIVKTYTLMDENPGHGHEVQELDMNTTGGGTGRKGKKFRKKDRMPVPTDDIDDIDDDTDAVV